MPTNRRILATGCFYHIYNCGVERRNVFTSQFDYLRFLETVAYYLFEEPVPFSQFKDMPLENRPKIPEWNQRRVTVLAYTLMPNHFHFLLKQERESGILGFISDVSNSYTKYFNLKKGRLGYLLQGRFQSKVIENEASLLQVGRYIHINPATSEKVRWSRPLQDYPYSSYRNYVDKSSDTIINIKEVSKYLDLKNYRNFSESRIKEVTKSQINDALFKPYVAA